MKKIYEVIQEEKSDCGICSLSCIIKYYNGSIPLETLRIDTNTNELGTNAYELINCAKKYGFDAYGKSVDKIDMINSPVIAHLKLKDSFYHFVVVYKINKKYVYIMDPSYGMKKMKLDDFYDVFTGVLLYFIPINFIPKYNSNKFIFKKLKLEFNNKKKKYIKLLVINFVVLVLSIIISMEIKLLGLNLKYFYLLFFIVIINEILIYLKNKSILKLSIDFNNKIIKYFINHIFKLPLKYLKLKRKGEIVTRFNELNEFGISLISSLIDIIFIICLLFLFFITLTCFSFIITSILIFFVIIYIFFNVKIYKRIVNDIRYSINLDENYNSNIIEYISNIETIKNINYYDYFRKNIFYNLVNKSYIKRNISIKMYKINFINSSIINILLLLILYLIIKYNYSLMNSLTIFILINYILENVKLLVSYLPTYYLLKSIMLKNDDFLSYKEYELKKQNNFKKISLKNLSYIINNNLILNNINFNISKNDKIFVMGPSGVGKSTLMKTINKEYDNYTGLILKDDVDIKNYDVSNMITYVSQESNIFDDTIINNITLGKKIDKDLLDNVIKICRLDDLINSKELKYDSTILNNSNISGGERNRIVLARSLIYSKELLILDEVLKEVDIKLEIEILKDLLEFYKDKTIIYISHKNVKFLFSKTLTLRKE